MEYDLIDEDEAPTPPKKTTSHVQHFVDLLEALPQGKVARVKPGPDQSTRGLKTSFGRIASARGWEVQTWDIPGEGVLYVKRLK